MEKDKILNLEAKLKYVFNNPKLLKMALTHKSYAYEQSSPDYDMYNERIEFLGDAILEHIISDLLLYCSLLLKGMSKTLRIHLYLLKAYLLLY